MQPVGSLPRAVSLKLEPISSPINPAPKDKLYIYIIFPLIYEYFSHTVPLKLSD
jgi:hypothetical protein